MESISCSRSTAGKFPSLIEFRSLPFQTACKSLTKRRSFQAAADKMPTACNGIRKDSGEYWRPERHITPIRTGVIEFRRLLIKHGIVCLNSEYMLS